MEQNERLYEGPRTRRIGSTRRTIEHAVEQLLHCGQTVVMDWSFLREGSRPTVEEMRIFVEKVKMRYFNLIGHITVHRIEWGMIPDLKHGCSALHFWVIEINNSQYGTKRKS